MRSRKSYSHDDSFGDKIVEFSSISAPGGSFLSEKCSSRISRFQ